MTLWTKSIDRITYADVVEFCDQKTPEGVNLDYKSELPDKLPKVVSSFANTSGGIVIVGVTTDIQNRPDKIVGIPNEKGFTERVAQLCRDGIHPPILPEMTQLLPLDSDSSKAVAVLRIAESVEAPHTIQNKEIVYARRGDVTDCIALANLDRIEYLLSRRTSRVGECDKNIDLNLNRLSNCLGIRPQAVMWCHVGPHYPWQNIWLPRQCVSANLGIELRPAPRGAIGIGEPARRNDSEGPTLFIAVDARGLCFRGKLLYPSGNGQPLLQLGDVVFQASSFFSWSSRFYEEVTAAYPGMMLLSIGFESILGQQIAGPRGWSPGFPDASYRIDQTMTYSEFLDADFSSSRFGASPMMNELRHAFGFRY